MGRVTDRVGRLILSPLIHLQTRQRSWSIARMARKIQRLDVEARKKYCDKYSRRVMRALEDLLELSELVFPPHDTLN